MKKAVTGLKDYFLHFGKAFANGDIWTKMSVLFMGAGHIRNGQIFKGVLVQAVQIIFYLFTVQVTLKYLPKLSTLGTVQREEQFDPLTMTKTVNHYDNSLLILLFSLVGIVLTVIFILFFIQNEKHIYQVQRNREAGKHINNFREDLKELINGKFYITLLGLPAIGVLLVNIIPILFMICIAFTNYDKNHQPPTYLFTWVGLNNFKTLFTTSITDSFGYVFVRILLWTFIWAFFSTFTTYFGGIFLAKFINDKRTHWQKMWRSLFVITIAIPQFVSLLLVGKMFSNHGIVNAFCNTSGLTGFLQKIGLVSRGLNYVPFLSKPVWAHIMVILINIWVGVPYQMLSATGILMNIPQDQLEAAKIDGASERQIFWKITMPYVLFVTGPSLLTAFIANINNFNVIYLLTTDFTTTNMKFANANAKEVDLLVTWLFNLTNNYSNFKMASVIGICCFVICVFLTLINFARFIRDNREEEFQ
jgi:arabinogalactan oligomer/maltooligosaccharide transport system permease protein